MKMNLWTAGLVAAGVVSLPAVVGAEESPLTPVLTQLSATTISGYVDTSAIWHVGTGNANMPGRSFDGSDKMDGFNFNVASLVVEKPLDLTTEWAAGYRVQMLMGPDAVGFNPVVGKGDTAGGDFGVKEAYVKLRLPAGNGLDLTMGTFSTPLGYEVFESGSNPNYSRSYGYYIEPTQHTGALLSYTLEPGAGWALTAKGGIANTYSAGIDNRGGAAESSKAYIGYLSLVKTDGCMKDAAFYAGVTDGIGGGDHRTTSLFAAAYLPFNKFALGVAWDYRFDGAVSMWEYNDEGDYEVTSGYGRNWAQVFGTYLRYDVSEKFKLNARVDYAMGTTGTFYVDSEGLARDNQLLSCTLTADYSLWGPAVITRGEVRWDHCLTGDQPFGGSEAGIGNDDDAVTLSLNVIYKF